MLREKKSLPLAILLAVPTAAQAYVGPGMGLGLIASSLGIAAAFLMAMVAMIWFPVKRMIKRRKANSAAPEEKDR